MSEHVFWQDDSGLYMREEIVRCRDCRYYDEIIHACERFDSIKQDNVSYVFDDGFCAWGERRERESVEVWNQWSTDDVMCSEES